MKQMCAAMKRLLALVLALTMFLSCADLGLVLHAQAAEPDAVLTDAEIIARHYSGLSDSEKALLNSGLLTGVSHPYAVPKQSEKDGPVFLDTDSKTVTAKKWDDGQGNT